MKQQHTRRSSATVRELLGSSVFFIGMVVSAVVVAPVSLLLWPFPYSVRFGFVSQWAKFNLWSAKVCCGLRFRVLGRENIPETPAITFCKHQSAWETLALQPVLGEQAWVLKRELLRVPFFGWGLAVLEPIAIDRDAGRKAAGQVVKEGKDRLSKGRWIVVFPEGTRVAVGEDNKFGIGGAMLAKKTGADILPIAHNAGCFWPRRGFVKRAGTITMVIGEPISATDKSLKEINRVTKEWIDRHTRELEHQAQTVVQGSVD